MKSRGGDVAERNCSIAIEKCSKLHTVEASNSWDNRTRSLSPSPLASTIKCSLGSQALLDVTHRGHFIMLVHATHLCVFFFAHFPFVVNRAFNSTLTKNFQKQWRQKSSSVQEIRDCSIKYLQHLQLTSLSEQCSSSCSSDTWHLGKSLKQRSTRLADQRLLSPRRGCECRSFEWCPLCRMANCGLERTWVKSNGEVGQPKPCRYLMNCKKHLVLIQLLEQWLPRQNFLCFY